MPIRFRRRQVRNWHDFLREILVITVGVLIALGASHVAEQWNWDRRIVEAESQLAEESAQLFLYAAEAVAVGPCVQAQLENLRARVQASGDVLDPAPLERDAFADFVVRIPSRPMGTTTWRALADDGTVPHLDDDRRVLYAQIEHVVDAMTRFKDATDNFVGRLRVAALPLPLDPGARLRLLETIEEQRYRSSLHQLMSLQVMALVSGLDNVPPATTVDDMIEQSGTAAFCRTQGLPMADWKTVLPPVPAGDAN